MFATKALLRVRDQVPITSPDNCLLGSCAGTTQTIGGIETYIATPAGEYPKDKVILFLTDAFGLKLENNKVSRPVSPQTNSNTA